MFWLNLSKKICNAHNYLIQSVKKVRFPQNFIKFVNYFCKLLNT